MAGLALKGVPIRRFPCRGLKLLDLAGQGIEVFVHGLFEQATLLGAEALGGRRELGRLSAAIESDHQHP